MTNSELQIEIFRNVMKKLEETKMMAIIALAEEEGKGEFNASVGLKGMSFELIALMARVILQMANDKLSVQDILLLLHMELAAAQNEGKNHERN